MREQDSHFWCLGDLVEVGQGEPQAQCSIELHVYALVLGKSICQPSRGILPPTRTHPLWISRLSFSQTLLALLQ